ncbi:hypothetical protein B0H14DRAFT_3440238 [Mycena olivaceomarginata]|nr:hypothetical protein B0H14DRAFT_3440238 [Mycena olivaceomarginata]
MKPSTKPVVASKVDKKEAAAAAAAKKSGVVKEVEMRKRGRPRRQSLEVATTNATVATPALEPANPPTQQVPLYVYSMTNNNRGQARAAAAGEQAAKEKERADAAVKQAAQGWSEKTVNGALVVTLTNPTNPQTRTRKPTRLADGSLPQCEVKGTRIKKPAPLDTVEEALLVRAKTGSKRKSATAATAPAKKKRKA